MNELKPGVLVDHNDHDCTGFDVATVQLAVEYGFAPSNDTTAYEYFASQGENGCPYETAEDEDEARVEVSELAEGAVAYLSEQCAPIGHYVAIEDLKVVCVPHEDHYFGFSKEQAEATVKFARNRIGEYGSVSHLSPKDVRLLCDLAEAYLAEH